MDKISVIVPVYNVEKYLSRCLDSILAQTYENIEIILVDDGSADNSGIICDEYAKKYDNIKVIHKENGGQSSARNEGLKAATGEYIGFVDSDDWIDKDMYAYLYKILKETDSDVADISAKFMTKAGQVIQPEIKLVTYEGKDILRNYMRTGIEDKCGQFAVWRKLYKRELFDNVRFKEGKIYEDILINFELLAKAKRIVRSNRILYFYFQENASTMRRGLTEKDYDLLDICENVLDLSEDESISDDEINYFAKVKLARSYFSLLARAAFFGIDEKRLNRKEVIRDLTGKLRKNFILLMKSPIPILRKILIMIMCININLISKPVETYKELKNERPVKNLIFINALAICIYIAICFYVPFNIYIRAVNQYLIVLLWLITAFKIDNTFIKKNWILFLCIIIMFINDLILMAVTRNLVYFNRFVASVVMFLVWPVLYNYTVKNYPVKLIKKIIYLTIALMFISLYTTNRGLNFDPMASRNVTRLTMGFVKRMYIFYGVGDYGFVYASTFILVAMTQAVHYIKNRLLKLLLISGIAYGSYVIIRTNFMIALMLITVLIVLMNFDIIKSRKRQLMTFAAVLVLWIFRMQIVDFLKEVAFENHYISLHYKLQLVSNWFKDGNLLQFARIKYIYDGILTFLKHPIIGNIWFQGGKTSGHSGILDYFIQFGVFGIWIVVFFVSAFAGQLKVITNKKLRTNLIIMIGGIVFFALTGTFLIYRQISVAAFYIAPLIFYVIQKDESYKMDKHRFLKNPNTGKAYTNIEGKELVSIIVPVYNMEGSLRTSVEALLQQTYGNIEIILVDDGSTDGSYKICQELAAGNEKVKVYHTENQGSGMARNYGIDKASGKYAYFPDADDILQIDAVEILVNEMESDECDMIVFGFREIDEQGQVVEKSCPAGSFDGDYLRRNYDIYYNNYNIKGAPWNKFFNLHKIKEENILYPSLRRHQDEVFILRYVTKAKRVRFISDVLYTYYTNSLKKEWEKYPTDYIEIVNELQKYQTEIIGSWNADNSRIIDAVNSNYVANYIKALELSFGKKFRFKKKERLNWITDKAESKRFLDVAKTASLKGLSYQRKILRYMVNKEYSKLYRVLHFKVIIELRYKGVVDLVKSLIRFMQHLVKRSGRGQEQNYEYKYLHIMLHRTISHNKSVIELLNSGDLGFNPREHLFVVKHRRVFEACKMYDNVVLDEFVTTRDMENYKNHAGRGRYIFLHCNELSPWQLYRIDNDIMARTIWCVWGHDLYYLYKPLGEVSGLYRKIKRLGRNVVKKIYEIISIPRLRHLYAVGAGFKYDAYEIKRKYGKDMRILRTPYGFVRGKKQKLEAVANEKYEKEPGSPYKIMIGHSSHRFLNHINVMEKLKKFKDENIVIALVLSYGDNEYAKQVERYALSNFKGKTEILKNYMPETDYLRWLKTVDACILDYTHQSALGNVWLLLLLGKKLFLNKDGIIKKALTEEGIETYNVSDIDSLSFEEFSSPVKNAENSIKLGASYADENKYIDLWKNTLEELS